MSVQDPSSRAGATLVWTHAVLYLGLAAVCYLWPRAIFGEAAWLPLAGLAVSLLGAVLVALAVALIACARLGSRSQIRLALVGALILDVQIPILMGLYPASFEHVQVTLGIPWFVVPLAFSVIAGFTAYRASRLALPAEDIRGRVGGSLAEKEMT